MSNLSRFELTSEDLEKPLPVLRPASLIEDELEELTQQICELDPQLAEVLFSLSFSPLSRDEKLDKIHAWGQV